MKKKRICFRTNLIVYSLAALIPLLFSLMPGNCAGADQSPTPSPAVSGSPADSGGTLPPSPQPSPAPAPALQQSPAPDDSQREDQDISELEMILQKMKMVNKGLRDYSSDVKVTGMGRYSILDIPLYVEGVYYYKEPDKHRLKVNRGPHYLSQYPQAFGWSLPNPRDWTCKVREMNENGRTFIVLKLVPVMGMGDLQKVEMWVDKSSYLFGRQIYFYRDGGKMTLDSSYRNVNGYSLFNKLSGHFEFPKKHIKADAEVEYGDYRINQGLDDSLFQETGKK